MKKHLLTISLALCALAASAQVNTAGLSTEDLANGTKYYIVSDNGYFFTSKGSNVVATDVAPAAPEWTATIATDGKVAFRNGSNYLSWGEWGNSLILSTDRQDFDVKANAFREGCRTVSSDIVVDFYGTLYDANYAWLMMNDGEAPAGFPSDRDIPDWHNDTYTMDFLFFSTLPEQIDNRGTGGGEEGGGEEGEIDVPENNIEGDFLANWQNSMQDAKVLTYVPMDETKLHLQHWNPARNGVTEYAGTLFTSDILERFYGNRAKNIYFVLPPNAVKITFFIKDASVEGIDNGILWSETRDYTEATNYLLKQTNNTEPVSINGYDYGNQFKTSLLEGTDYPYYTPGQITAIPCDYTISPEYPNLLVGYTVTYPGEYKDNYINGKNGNNGLKDGTWFKSAMLLPTSLTGNAFVMGNDDPDLYDGRFEDYTGYQAILMAQYRWCDNAGLFCYVETEGQGGFPHSDIRFDEVKVTRCYTDDAKVPFKATFTNYGVDPILSASFDVKVGEKTTRLNFKDGIKFLEQASLDDDITPPATPSRQTMNVTIAKINGKEVNIPSAVNGSIIAINYYDDVTRMPVIEENTGTWCGWCPRGLVGMEKLREKYGEDVALIGIHTGADPRANGMMDQVLATFGATGAPTCLINRICLTDPYYGTSSTKFGIYRDTQKISDLITEASVAIKGVALNPEKTQLAVLSNTTFNIDAETSPYRLTYVITEDGQSYQQMSYYITQTSAAEKEDYRKNDPDLYELTQKTQPWKPVINDIMEYCDEPMGIPGSLPAPIVKGQPIEHRQVITLPKLASGGDYIKNLDNCRLIALLVDTESLEIVNAAQIKLNNVKVSTDFEEFYTGIDTVLAPASQDGAAASYDILGRPATSDTYLRIAPNGRVSIRK